MQSNNPFKVHNIEHLSPSKINLWVSDPALFVGTYLCGMKGSLGVGAFRGTAVEYALSKRITSSELSDTEVKEMLYAKYQTECLEHNVDLEDPKTIKEGDTLESYYNTAFNKLNFFTILLKFLQWRLCHKNAPTILRHK